MIREATRLPNAIKLNDKIGVLSPSEPIVETRIDRLNGGVNLLESLGFRVSLSKNAYKQYYYMAGTIEERTEDFNSFLVNDDISMIMTSWGGKNSNQLLDKIDYSALDENPKLVCGFSDPTNFLNAIYAKTGIPALYGPDVVGKLIEDPEEDIKNFKLLICDGEKLKYSGTNISTANTIKSGTTEGILIGGNLSCFIVGILGTEYQPNLEGSILFFETGSPKPRELQQMLTYLRHYGVFDKISGMVVGYIGGVDSRSWANRPIKDIVLEETLSYDFPIVHLPIFGHGDCPKAPIPIGIPARLDADEITLTLLSSLVK